MGLKGLEKPTSTMTVSGKLIGFLGGFIGIAFLGMAVYFGLGWIKVALPNIAFPFVIILCTAAYLILLWFASRHDDLVVDPPDAPIVELPRAWCNSNHRTVLHPSNRHFDLVHHCRAPVTGSVGFLGNDRHDHGCAHPASFESYHAGFR